MKKNMNKKVKKIINSKEKTLKAPQISLDEVDPLKIPSE